MHPTIVVGHSLGEFAAATAASLITVEDALRIVGARCKLVETLPGGKMVAVSADSDTCLGLISGFLKTLPSRNTDWLDIAAYNSKDNKLPCPGHLSLLMNSPNFVKTME